MFFDPAYQSLKNGLVGYWSPVATGPTGLQLLDLSGYNNHGTLNGMDAPTDWVDSPYGKVLDFDGTNDSVNTDLKTDFTDFTIAGWYRSTGAALGNFDRIADNVYSVTNTGTNTGFALCRQSSSLNTWGCYLIANGVVPTPIVVTLSDGNWHLLVATRKGTTLTVYGDGGAVSSSGTVSSAAFTNQPLKIGYSSIAANHNAFLGQIGDVSYWNRALNPSEVQALYSLGQGRLLRNKTSVSIAKRKWWPGVKTPKSRPIIPTQRGIKSGPIFYDPKASWFRNGLVGHWCPSATSPTGTQLLDLSGGNNNGTLTNMPVSTSWVTNGGKGALSFSASNSYVATTKIGAAGSEPRAGFAWINTSVAGGAIIEWGANTITQRWNFGIANTTQYGNTLGQLWVENWGTLRSAGPTVNDGNWHHVGYSYTGGNLNTTLLWIDGISYVANQGTLGTGVVNTATTSPITIGYSLTSASSPFNGVIDDVRVYNRAVTAGEVAKLYAGGRGYGVSSKPYRRSSYSPATKKIFKSRIDRKRSVSLVHPDQDNQWITNGLVGFWCPSLTGATGTQLLDLSGQNNNGVLTGMDAPTDWVSSPYGTVLDFDGTNDYVTTSSKDYDYITLSGWVKVNAGATAFLINKNYNGANVPFSLSAYASAAIVRGFAFFDGSWRSTGIGTSDIRGDGLWHHIAGTFDGTNLLYYVDGKVAASNTVTAGVLPKNSNPIDIGVYRNDSNHFGGQIASACIHNRALTPSEIQTLYQLGPRMGFSRRPSRSPTWMVEADETIGNRRRRIICGGKN